MCDIIGDSKRQENELNQIALDLHEYYLPLTNPPIINNTNQFTNTTSTINPMNNTTKTTINTIIPSIHQTNNHNNNNANTMLLANASVIIPNIVMPPPAMTYKIGENYVFKEHYMAIHIKSVQEIKVSELASDGFYLFIYLFIYSFIYSFFQSFIYSFIRLFNYSFIHSFIHFFNHFSINFVCFYFQTILNLNKIILLFQSFYCFHHLYSNCYYSSECIKNY